MRAPPESIRPMIGTPLRMARSITRQILCALHLGERAAINGEILRIDIHRPAVDLAIAGDDAIAQVFLGSDPHLVALVGDERLQLVESAGVEQQLQPFACGQLALGMLCIDSVLPATQVGFFA